MIEEYASKKLDCFTEEVIQVKKMDIQFICTDQGAHKTLKDALDHALEGKINCGHVDCEGLEEAIKNGKQALVSLNIVDDKNITAITVEEPDVGVAD